MGFSERLFSRTFAERESNTVERDTLSAFGDGAPARALGADGLDQIAPEYLLRPADHMALIAGPGQSRAGTFADDLALELGDGRQDVQQQARRRVGAVGVDPLGGGDEPDLITVVHHGHPTK